MRALTAALWCLPVAAGLLARSAGACGLCDTPPFTPTKPLPVNLLGLPPEIATLTHFDGGDIPLVPTNDGVLPTEALQAGEVYRMTSGSMCGSGGPWIFTAAPSAPVPEHAGTLSVTPRYGHYETASGDSGRDCLAIIEGDGARIELEPDPQLEPWFELSKARVVVDGEPWAGTLQFGIPWATSQYGLERLRFERYRFDVFGACVPVPEGATPGFSPGHHQGVMFVHLAGTNGDLPGLVFDFDIHCYGCGCGTSPAGALLIAALLWSTRRGRRGRR